MHFDIMTILSGLSTLALFFLGWRLQRILKLINDLISALEDGQITAEEIKKLIEDLQNVKTK